MLHGALNIAAQAIASVAQGLVAGKAARDLATRAGRADVTLAQMQATSAAEIGASNRALAVALVPVVIAGVVVAGLAYVFLAGRKG